LGLRGYWVGVVTYMHVPASPMPAAVAGSTHQETGFDPNLQQ
jgi:hypothetical protein